MIAVLTPVDQSKYLLMQADVEMADIDTSPTIKMVLTPLSVAGTPVGTPIETEAVPVNPDGSFVLPFGNVAVTGEANPINGGDIEADRPQRPDKAVGLYLRGYRWRPAATHKL